MNQWSVGIDASVGDRRCRGPNKVRFKKSFVFYFCLKLYPLSDKQSQILPGRGRCRKVRKSAVYGLNVNQYTISNCSPRCRHSLVLTFIDSDFMSSPFQALCSCFSVHPGWYCKRSVLWLSQRLVRAASHPVFFEV